MEIGTAGLSDFFGTEPVIATQIMQGLLIDYSFFARENSISNLRF
jgi:hypothetical protein